MPLHPDETTDTGFSETICRNAAEISTETSEFSKETELPEKRTITIAEKGLEFRSAVKEKLARAANKNFHAHVTAYHAFLVSSKDRNMIDDKIKELVTLAEKTELELSAWLDLEKNTPKAEVITDLLVTVKDSLQGARSAAFNKLASLDKEETASALATKIDKVKVRQVSPGLLEPDRFNHFSSLNRLKRCIVRLQRAIERLRPNKQMN